MAYTNDTLLAQIKSRAFIPTDQSTFTNQQLLDLASDELNNTILPMIQKTRNEFYVTSSDHSVTASSRSIDMPYRALGLALRDVVRINGSDEISMPLISPENKDNFNDTNGYGFYLQGNKIKILGTFTGSVRLYYYLRPGDLTETSNASKITSIDTGTNTVVVASAPTTWTTATILDLIQYRPGFDTRSTDLTVSSISSNTIVLSALPDGLIVGDWVTVAETSPVPQIPIEFYPYLAQLVAVKVLEGVGDFDGMNAAGSRLAGLEKAALQLISPRVKGEAKKLTGHRRRNNAWNIGGY